MEFLERTFDVVFQAYLLLFDLFVFDEVSISQVIAKIAKYWFFFVLGHSRFRRRRCGPRQTDGDHRVGGQPRQRHVRRRRPLRHLAGINT